MANDNADTALNGSGRRRSRGGAGDEDQQSPGLAPSPYDDDRREHEEVNAFDDGRGGKKYDLSVPICKDFTRNRCFRSQLECRYAHPPPAVAAEGDKVTVCYDSLRDRCARGYACRYFHPPPQLRVRMQESIGVQPSPVPVGYQVNQVTHPNVLYGPPAIPPPPVQASAPPPVKTSTRPSIEVCRDFLRGRCARDGGECRFAHHTPTAGDGEYVIVCQDFLRGKCVRDACRYFHCPNHLRSRIKDLPVGPTSGTGDRGFLDESHTYGANTYEHEGSKRMRLDDGPLDWSHRGSSGPYYGGGYGASLYPVSPMPPLPPPPPIVPPPSSMRPMPTTNDEDRLPVCRDFVKNKCARGMACRFVHPEPHTQVVDNYVTLCRDFLRGKCKREQCRFYHPPTKEALRQDNGGSAAAKGVSSAGEGWNSETPSPLLQAAS